MCFGSFENSNARYIFTLIMYKQYIRKVQIFLYDTKTNQMITLWLSRHCGIECTCITSYLWKCKHVRFIETEIFKLKWYQCLFAYDMNTSQLLLTYVLPYCRVLQEKLDAKKRSQETDECAFCLETVNKANWNIHCKTCNFIIHDTCWVQWYYLKQHKAIKCSFCNETLSITNCYYDVFYREYDIVLFEQKTKSCEASNSAYTLQY